MALLSTENFEMQFYDGLQIKRIPQVLCCNWVPPTHCQARCRRRLATELNPTQSAVSRFPGAVLGVAHPSQGQCRVEPSGTKPTRLPQTQICPHHSPLSGTARGHCLQCHCCVWGVMAPFPPHLGDSGKIVLVPQGCLGDS